MDDANRPYLLSLVFYLVFPSLFPSSFFTLVFFPTQSISSLYLFFIKNDKLNEKKDTSLHLTPL